MLGRYQIRRGQPLSALPAAVRAGRREDCRKHTRHCLRPDAAAVQAYLAAPGGAAFAAFARGYRDLLAARFAADRAPFDALAARARAGDVFLGCNCPTTQNPDVRRCHTTLALEFMRRRYPDLEIAPPE